jgi:hypothetical protein
MYYQSKKYGTRAMNEKREPMPAEAGPAVTIISEPTPR